MNGLIGCEGESGDGGEHVSLIYDGVDWDDSSMLDGVLVGAFGGIGATSAGAVPTLPDISEAVLPIKGPPL
nr:hypothetical protein [Tanacetum cinerariifolium]